MKYSLLFLLCIVSLLSNSILALEKARATEEFRRIATTLSLTRFGLELAPQERKLLIEALQKLLRNGANPDSLIKDSQTLLHTVAFSDQNNDVLKMLLAHNAYASKDTSYHYEGTPLHNAAIGAASQNARLLLEAGAQVNAGSDRGTPLHLALKNTYPANAERYSQSMETIKLLVNAGASLSEKTTFMSQSVTVIELALALNLHEYTKIFRKKIAQPFKTQLTTISQPSSDSFLSLLPGELLEEIAVLTTNDDYNTIGNITRTSTAK